MPKGEDAFVVLGMSEGNETEKKSKGGPLVGTGAAGGGPKRLKPPAANPAWVMNICTNGTTRGLVLAVPTSSSELTLRDSKTAVYMAVEISKPRWRTLPKAEEIARHRPGRKCSERVNKAIRGPKTQFKMQKTNPPLDIRNKQVTPRPPERNATAKGAQQKKGNVTLVNSMDSLPKLLVSPKGPLVAVLMSAGSPVRVGAA